MLPEEQLMRGQQVLPADSEDLWDEQYQMEVSTIQPEIFECEIFQKSALHNAVIQTTWLPEF